MTVIGPKLPAQVLKPGTNGQFVMTVGGVAVWTTVTPSDPVMGGDLTGTASAAVIANGAVTAAKLANALKPSAGAAGATEALRALGTSGSTAAAGNDSRLSDARTPLGHHTTHELGGGDQLSLDMSLLTGGADGQVAKRVAGVWTPTDDYVPVTPTIQNSTLRGSTTVNSWLEQPSNGRAQRRGFLGWSFDPKFHGTAAAPTAGVVRLNSIDVEEMGTFSKVSIWMQGGTPALTNSFVGVYRKQAAPSTTAVLIALSGNISSTFNSPATLPLGADVAVTAQGSPLASLAVNPGDVLYGATLFNGTPGTMMIQSGSAQQAETNAFVALSDFFTASFGTGLTALPTTIDLSTVTLSAGTIQFMGVK